MDIIYHLLLVILAVLLGCVVLQRILLFRKMAPGPYGIPIFGSLLHLMRVDNIQEFQKYKKKYGKVFSFSAGDYYVTVVADPKLVISCLKKEEFQGRPDFPLWDIRNGGTRNRGIVLSDGPTWQEQRRFALRILRDFGFGKESMEGMLLYELQELQNVLGKDVGHPVSLSGAFNAAVLNSLWCILTGRRFELGDPTLKTLITLMIDLQDFQITTPGLFFFRPIKNGWVGKKMLATLMAFLNQTKDILRQMVEEHMETYEETGIRDFVDGYLHQIKQSSPGSSFYLNDGRENLIAVLLDLFLGGAETTSTTLQWAFLYLCKYPAVQTKVQQEIDSVVGRNRPPNRSDKPRLIYLDAVMNEVHRVASLIPFTIFHKATQDTDIDGYFVPKDCVLFLSIYDAHHDQDVWDEPEVFRPERHLDDSGTKLVKHDAFIPFSIGPRQCIGETLARDTIFLFFVGLLQKFTFELDPKSTPTDLRGTPTVVSSPPPFKVILKERK